MSSNKILSEINAISQKIDIDKITYYGILEEYPIPDIIDFEWKNILNKPPENSSSQTYKELLEIYNLSSSRSQADIEFVYAIDNDANKYLYDYLEKQNIEFPREEFDILYNIIRPILLNIKSLYNRPRPYQLGIFYGLNIEILESETHHTPSYPSGHVVYTSLAANMIKKYYPKITQKIDSIVNMTGLARMIQGVHYKSDVIAGNKLATILYKKLSGDK
jgi:acid phosphatase (class A)